MDELEISGKRYISSRRAAKEHRYHIDYIGQLIRAGKITGKKVGRAWYVEESSLDAYLAQESGSVQAAPVVTAETPVATVLLQTKEEAPTEDRIEVAELVEEPVEEEVTEEAPAVEEEVEEKIEVHLVEKAQPVVRTTLTYMEDTEPLLPVIGTRVRTNADFMPAHTHAYAPMAVEDTEEREVAPVVTLPIQKTGRKISPVRFYVLAVVGVVVLAAVAVSAGFVASSITVVDGKPASVGFSIK